ncbi:PAS domain-containing sensor histidine kinase [Rufibacter sp. XAAS-G3-1]|uniref:PAS domain-containing sensor histidine kinase n=1 Tax=Rufibacter sp. XAAS-G3-1 TaxID=2729134 RepID=UPI002102016A|nr:PAS domain-containing sensor histidine kinase [Rufibacter sp. XAAS-G3-1]
MSTPEPGFLDSLAAESDQVFFSFSIPEQRLTYLNPAFERVWQQTRQSVASSPEALLKAVHPEDQAHVREIFQDLLQGKIIPDVEFRIRLRGGTEKWVCVWPRILEDHSAVVGLASDITDQKRYNDTLKKFSDKKNSILNILSHDLAGPLGMIHSLSQMLGDGKEEDAREIIGIIEKSSRQGMQLIQDFIKQEFLESSEVKLIKRRVDLAQAIRECMEEYRQTQGMTGKNFRFHASPEKVYLEVDDTKLMQVVNNLLSNALKFTPDGGQITVSLEEREDSVLVTVADTGVGIPEKYHHTLFDKFTRARRPGIKGEPSVGLGMSIIRTIVEWHGGSIRFESEENKGTTFFIELPKG